MSSTRALLAGLVGMLVLSGAAPAASGEQVQIAPVTRLPFPERGFVVSVSEATELHTENIVVRENGVRVTGVRVDPLASSGLRFGVVLALDASESMTGAPAAAALQSARAFVTRRTDSEEVGIVAFNGDISVLRGLTREDGQLRARTRDAAAAGVWDSHSRRAGAVACAAARSEALLRFDRPALGRRGPRQPALARRGGRRGEEAADAHLHRRAALPRLRRRAAPRDRRTDRRVVRGSSLGCGARVDLRGARRAAGRRVSRPLSVGRASDVAGRGRCRGRRGRQRHHCVRGADAVAPGSVSPVVVCRRSSSRAARRSWSPCSSDCSSVRCCSCWRGVQRRRSSTASRPSRRARRAPAPGRRPRPRRRR